MYTPSGGRATRASRGGRRAGPTAARNAAHKAVLALAAGLATGCGPDVPDVRDERPNVILVVMDTTRGDRCGFNGYHRPTTPRLDELAREGVTFRDAWSPAGWTLPAHASLFTGQRPVHHGVLDGIRLFLEPQAVTLAERLKDAGYRTAAFSNNSFVSGEFGLIQGFETFEPHYVNPDRKYPSAPYTLDRALTWALDPTQRDRPFFVFVNNMEPHMPYTPPEDVQARFLPPDATPEEVAEARGFEFPLTMRLVLGLETLPPRRWEMISAIYDAEIATLDAALGDMLDRLRASGEYDRTVVIITADHGENIGEHGLCEHRASIHRPIRHVPLVVRYPGHFDGGRQVTSPVRLEDVKPTVLELAGLPLPPELDGVPLSRDLPGRISLGYLGPQSQEVLDLLERNMPGVDPGVLLLSMRAVYDGRFHYIRRSDGVEELYDISADPAELHDLAGHGGPELDRLRALLDDEL
jgi:arylsulfatase A-like enzyme